MQAALAAGEIAYDPDADGWHVTGFRIAREILSDDAFRKPDFAPLATDSLPRAIGQAARRGEALQRLWATPPPEPAWPVRRTFVAAFAPRRLDELRDPMRAEAARLLARADGDGFDLDRDFAQPFTQWAIARLYGIGADEIPRVARMTEPLAGAFSFDERSRMAAAMAMATIEPVLTALLREPSRGGATALETVQAALAAGEIGLDEALSWTGLTLLAGLQTNRRFLVRWLSEPGIDGEEGADIDSAGLRRVAELTRLYVDIISPARQSTRELALDGATIRAGSPFLLDLAAINRDPKRFAEPERFCPGRQDGGHLSFGYGPHMCVGRHLAMMQIDSVLHLIAAGGPAMRDALARGGSGPAGGGAVPH